MITGSVASVRRRLTGAGAWVRRTGLRTRVAFGLGLVVVIALGIVGCSTVSAARDAEVEAKALINEVSTLSIGQLLEPEVYRGLAQQAARTDQAVATLKSRLTLLRPLEFVPFLGGQVKAARNTAEAAHVLASATILLSEASASALVARQAGDADAFNAVFSSRAQELESAMRSLQQVEALLEGKLLLDAGDIALLRGGVLTLQTVTLLAAESPQAIEDGVEVLQGVFNLQQLLVDPWTILQEADKVDREVSLLQARAQAVSSEVERLAQNSDSPDEILDIAASGLALVDAIAETAVTLLGVVDAMEEGFLTPEFGAEAGGLLDQAQARAELARERWSSLRESLSTGVAGDLAEGQSTESLFEPVDNGLNQLDQGILTLRGLLGYDEPKTYLLVLQNQNEIRATGGFIGVGVEVRLNGGVMGNLTYVDSTTVDRPPLVDSPPAPEPLFWYLWMGRLLFRDANWSPHFPASAERLMEIYGNGRNIQLDGVVAGTKLLGLDLVDTLSGMTVPGVEGILTREQTFRYMEGIEEYECTERHVSTRGKRCFDEDLFEAMTSRLREPITDQNRAALIDVVRAHLESKNLLLYVTNEVTAELINDQGWDGAIPRAPQDFLMVVDSSLPGHTTAQIDRSIDYTVDLEPGAQSSAELRVRYHNDRPDTAITCRQAIEGGGGCYWNYMRIFIPQTSLEIIAPPIPLHEGSEKLIWGHRDPDSSRVLPHAGGGLQDLTEIGGFITVDGQTTLTVPVSYKLAPQVIRQVGPGRYEYRLVLTKQPGMDRDQVHIRVLLPSGASVQALSAGAEITDAGTVEYRDVLLKDQELVVVFTVAGS